jgi:Protein of unknown function (DUF3099)
MSKEEAVSITSAQSSLSKDQSGRARRYFLSMMIRTACFILTVILPSPYRWIALSGALLLPYVAVIVANAGRETIQGKTVFYENNLKAISDGKTDRA